MKHFPNIYKQNIIQKDSSDSSILRINVSRLVDTMEPKVFFKGSTNRYLLIVFAYLC